MNKRFLTALLTGAFFIASASMFVSCKDYDDDIKKNTDAISALQSELASLKTSLTSELEATKASLNTALQSKADVADLTALASRVSALETQIKEIDNCAKKSDLEALATTVATLTGRVDDLEKLLGEETAARKAVEDNLKLQEEALKTLEGKQRFLFITGVSKFSKVSVFSDLNNLKDYTLNAAVATLFGYTHGEVRENFPLSLAALGEKLLNYLGGSPALPHNRVSHTFPSLPVPEECGFPLICYTYRGDFPYVNSAKMHRFPKCFYLACQNILRIMLHPARLWIVLGKLLRVGSHDLPFFRKHNRPRARGTLIQRNQVCHIRPASCFSSPYPLLLIPRYFDAVNIIRTLFSGADHHHPVINRGAALYGAFHRQGAYRFPSKAVKHNNASVPGALNYPTVSFLVVYRHW